MAARLRRVSTKNNSPDAVLFRRYFVAAACHTQSMAARLRRVSAKNNSPGLRFFSADTLLQPLAIHKVWLRACAASRRKITRRMRFYSADTLLQPLAALLFYCRAGPACPAVECTSGGGTHGSRPTGLFAGGYGVPHALIPSPPRAAWHCGRGGCAPVPPRRRRWACGSPAAAWASCRTRTPGTPAGRCSRWPAPAWFS